MNKENRALKLVHEIILCSAVININPVDIFAFTGVLAQS